MMEKMPNSTCWNITSRCNDKCQFCYREQNSKELGFEEQKKVIDKVAESGIKKLTFAGGEPLLIPHIEELVLYAKEKGLLVSMTSNCILMTPEKLKFCFEHLDWLTLSLDGAEDELQQKMTRNAKHVSRMLHILKEAMHTETRNCRIKINTVVSSINQKGMEALADVVLQYPVDRWKLFQFTPIRGNAKGAQQKFEISREAFYQVVDVVAPKLEGTGKLLTVSDSENIESAYFVIFPNGDIRISSDSQDRCLGNVLMDNIQEIWETGGYLKKLHEERTGFVLKRAS